MVRRWSIPWLVLTLAAWLVPPLPVLANQTPAPPPQVSLSGPPQLRPIVNRYCVSCHSDSLRTGGLSLETMDAVHVSEGAELWERVLEKLRLRAMPPPGRPRPGAVSHILSELCQLASGGLQSRIGPAVPPLDARCLVF